MSVTLRVLLLVVSILTAAYIARKLRKSQMQVFDAVFWLLFSFVLVLMSLFPSVITYYTKVLGVISPVNFVFLVMIFLLFLRCFLLSVRVSSLEEKVKELVEEIAVRDNLNQKNEAEEKRDENIIFKFTI